MDISGANLDFSDIDFGDFNRNGSSTFQPSVHIFTFKSDYSQIAYLAKCYLHNSITRTLYGFTQIRRFEVLNGSINILSARIESLWALVLLNLATLVYFFQLFLIDVILIPITVLNLGSKSPLFSSYKSMEKFRKDTNEFIYRILRINLIVLPIIILFSTTNVINTFLPGALAPDNPLSVSIDLLIKPLGPLQAYTATIPNKRSITGTKKRFSTAGYFEEFLRCLSFKNYLKTIETNYIYHSR